MLGGGGGGGDSASNSANSKNWNVSLPRALFCACKFFRVHNECDMTNSIKLNVRPAKIQINLGIRSV